MAVLEYTYRYPQPSALTADAGLALATSGVETAPSLFFRGRLTAPRRAADLLLALSRVVRSRYHMPAAMLARLTAESDPVVTCAEDVLRFEGFSSCCSAYARVDLLPEAAEGSLLAPGTTNVDFNPGMRAALARVGEGDTVRLTVGQDAVEVATEAGTAVERRVPMPVRWLKGFVESQAHQARLSPRFEVGAAEARRFLRSLPRAGAKEAWLAAAGGALRLGQTPRPGAVRLAGVERLRVLEDLARHARGLRVHGGDDTECTAWELLLPDGRFVLALSPEVWRGFSGEGQALSLLADRAGETHAEHVRAALRWQSALDTDAVAAESGLTARETRVALAHLAALGLVGWDVSRSAYFHRELPYDYARIESLNPRLRDARALVRAGGVRIERAEGESVAAWVPGSGVEHHVRLTREGARCSCPWFARHAGERGPCKHVLAVQLLALGEGDDP